MTAPTHSPGPAHTHGDESPAHARPKLAVWKFASCDG